MKFNHLQAKLVEYAYPTSSHATKAGFGKTGCWFVSIYPCVDSTIGGKALKHFATKAEANAYAESLPLPWNNMVKYSDLQSLLN